MALLSKEFALVHPPLIKRQVDFFRESIQLSQNSTENPAKKPNQNPSQLPQYEGLVGTKDVCIA